MRIWCEMSPKAQSADTFREAAEESIGTCEFTRLSFASATKYFVYEPVGQREAWLAMESEKRFLF